MLWWRRQDSAFWQEQAGLADPVLARTIHKEDR
jgi:hypothetical protein